MDNLVFEVMRLCDSSQDKEMNAVIIRAFSHPSIKTIFPSPSFFLFIAPLIHSEVEINKI